MFVLINVVILIVLSLIDTLLGHRWLPRDVRRGQLLRRRPSLGLLSGLYTLAVLLPSIAVTVRPAARHRPHGLVDPARLHPDHRRDRAAGVLRAGGHAGGRTATGPTRRPRTREGGLLTRASTRNQTGIASQPGSATRPPAPKSASCGHDFDGRRPSPPTGDADEHAPACEHPQPAAAAGHLPRGEHHPCARARSRRARSAAARSNSEHAEDEQQPGDGVRRPSRRSRAARTHRGPKASATGTISAVLAEPARSFSQPSDTGPGGPRPSSSA